MSLRSKSDREIELENSDLDCILNFLIEKFYIDKKVGTPINEKTIEKMMKDEYGKKTLEEARKSCELKDFQQPIHNLDKRLVKRLKERTGLCLIETINQLGNENDEFEIQKKITDACGINKLHAENITKRVNYINELLKTEEFEKLIPEEYRYRIKENEMKEFFEWLLKQEMIVGRMLSLHEFIELQNKALEKSPISEEHRITLISENLYDVYTNNNDKYKKENMVEITKEIEHYTKELGYEDKWEGAEALEKAIKENAKPEKGKEVKVDVTEDNEGRFWLNIENEQLSDYWCFTKDMDFLKEVIGSVEYVTFDEVWKIADEVGEKLHKKGILTDESTIIAIPRGGQIVLGVFALKNGIPKSHVFPQFIPIELKEQIVKDVKEGKGVPEGFEFKNLEERPFRYRRYGEDKELDKKEEEKVEKQYYYRNLFRGGGLMTGQRIILLDDVVLSGQRMTDAIDSLRSIVGTKIPIYPVTLYGSARRLQHNMEMFEKREESIKHYKDYEERVIKDIREGTYFKTEEDKQRAIKNEREKTKKHIEDRENTHPLLVGEVIETGVDDRPNILFQWSIPDYTPIYKFFRIIPKEKLIEKKAQSEIFKKTKEFEY